MHFGSADFMCVLAQGQKQMDVLPLRSPSEIESTCLLHEATKPSPNHHTTTTIFDD